MAGKRQRRGGKERWRRLRGFSFPPVLLKLSQDYDSWSDRERNWDKQQRRALCVTLTPVLSFYSHQPPAGAPSTSLSLPPKLTEAMRTKAGEKTQTWLANSDQQYHGAFLLTAHHSAWFLLQTWAQSEIRQVTFWILQPHLTQPVERSIIINTIKMHCTYE